MNAAFPTAGIAGAGLMGRLLGLFLAEAGYRVHLFDSGDQAGRQSAAWSAGGMLSPHSELDKAETLIARLGLRSLHLWRQLLPRLGRPTFFAEGGTVVVAHRQDSADLEAFLAQVHSRTSTQTGRALDAQTLAALEPELAGRFGRGWHFPDEAQLEPRDVLPALGHALERHGATFSTGRAVQAIEPGRLIFADGAAHFDLAVDTRGLGARPQLPLRGVRGELLRLHAPEVGLRHMVRLMHPRYPLYIVPRPHHTYLVGATSIESDHEGPISVRSALELLSAVYSLHPGFAEASVLEQTVGHRPAFSDNLPRLHCEPGLLRVNGLYRHGFLISPALAEAALAQLRGEPLPYPELEVDCHVATHG